MRVHAARQDKSVYELRKSRQRELLSYRSIEGVEPVANDFFIFPMLNRYLVEFFMPEVPVLVFIVPFGHRDVFTTAVAIISDLSHASTPLKSSASRSLAFVPCCHNRSFHQPQSDGNMSMDSRIWPFRIILFKSSSFSFKVIIYPLQLFFTI